MGLSVKKVSLHNGRSSVLHNIDFAAERGQVWALVGGNGVGKSTLLRALAGLQEVSFGAVEWDGHGLVGKKANWLSRNIAWLGQTLPQVEGMRVETFLGFTPEGVRVDAKTRTNALDRFDIGTFLQRPLTELSGGEWRRVQLARFWMSPAHLWLLDEPTAGLDPRHVRALAEGLRLQPQRVVLISSHEEGFLSSCASHAVCLGNGTVAQQGALTSGPVKGWWRQFFEGH